MEEIEVKFKVEYFLEIKEPLYCARLRVFIKAEKDEIPKLLRAKDKTFLGQELDWCWGHMSCDGRYRCASKILSGSSWEEVKEMVKREVDECIRILQEVKKENLKKLQGKPEDEVIVVEI